jgi:hypothetical protein
MATRSKEILEELKSVLKGKTLDALIPPVIFVIINGIFGLVPAVIAAIGVGFFFMILRLIRRESWQYAVGGIGGVVLAGLLAYLTQNAASYFIPAMITSGIFLLMALVSLILKKPMAAWVSHLTRGWPLDWFWREDVRPAYVEVTWIWALFFGMRFALQLLLIQQGEATTLGWVNLLLGWPVTVLILVISYVYGIWRLSRLGGPGVDEFQEGKAPPWDGQRRGF